MFITDMKIASPFKDLFPIRENVLNEIVADMKKNGFDKSRPIVLDQNNTVIDGHTRLQAAEIAKIDDVPTVMKDFPNEDLALEYAIKCQRNCRNLTDEEILKCVAELDKRKSFSAAGKAGRAKQLNSLPSGTGPERTSKATAGLLGISHRKVERTRAVLDKAPDEIKDAVKSGKMTINKAYEKTMDSPAKSIRKIRRVIGIIRERLSKEQIDELIKILEEELNGQGI